MVERVRPEDVATYPYWRSDVRLGDYKRDRFALEDLEPTVSQLQVRLRGWYFPHVPHTTDARRRSADFVEAWSNFGGFEFWRFYRSAQLFHLKNLRENLPEDRPEVERITRRRLSWNNPSWERIAGYVDVIRALYHVAEVYEFASRLSGRLDYRGNVQVAVSLVGIENFILTIADESRSWDHLYHYSEQRLDDAAKIDAQSLIADSAPHALEALYRIFYRFGWDRPQQSVLASEIRKYLRQ